MPVNSRFNHSKERYESHQNENEIKNQTLLNLAMVCSEEQ